MVSRRTLLAAGTALPAGAASLGLSGSRTPADAASRGIQWSPSWALPTFARPRHLDVADLSGVRGDEQILLTTLQGVVNRRRPSLYYTFDLDGDVDERWLHSMKVPVTRHSDPMSLVAAHRAAVKGAIVYDSSAPDTINVATTMAGLNDCVVTTADQAHDLRLPIVEDLRDRFEDSPIASSRWQLRHLWPRCEHRLVAGLSPTQVVDVEDVTWQHVAREDQQIRDGSNRDTYTLDASAALGGDAVYVRFSDSFPDDGWGPSITSLTATVDGTTIVSFDVDTSTEQTYLFDGRHSSIGGEHNRFADGGGYYIYRFPTPGGARRFTVTVTMWGQYQVDVTDTAPTRVEPFPYFRDYIVATRAMVCWLAPNGHEGDTLTTILDRTEPTAPYLGWFSNNVAGEWGGVDLASRSSTEVIAADFFMNGTVHGGVRAHVSPRRRPTRPSAPRNRVYVTFTVGEGDNIQYCQRHMRNIWDHPQRGETPTNWTISPMLAQAGPAIYRYYQQTATDNDLLVCGPSGAGYTYPGAWPTDTLDRYTELTGRYLHRTGLDLVYAYNNRNEDGWIPPSERILESYDDHTPLRGMILSWGEGGVLDHNPFPVIGNFAPAGDPDDYKLALDESLEDWNGSSPTFIAAAIDAWRWTPADITALAKMLQRDGRFEIVLGNEFFALLGNAATTVPLAGLGARSEPSVPIRARFTHAKDR